MRRVLVFILVFWGLAHGLAARADDLGQVSQNIISTSELVAKGGTLFMSHCMSCHGPEGRGDGPAAGALNPKPRNFTTEQFKQGASPSATFHTVTHGLGSMPSFSSLPVADRLALVHYVLSLSPHREKDTSEALAKIGLDPSGKPLAGFTGAESRAVPVEFIMERMAQDGDVNSLNYALLARKMEEDRIKDLPPEPKVIKPDLHKGAVIFESCKACHGRAGEGSQLSQAPQIAGQDAAYVIAQIKKFQTGARGAHPEDANGLKMRPMSRMLRSEEEVVHVAHYVSQLTPKEPLATIEGGDPEKGKMAFGVCIACHGSDGRGIKAMSAPALVGQHDWYIMGQVNKFKAGYRGTDPRDTTGAVMRGMAMTLADEQAIKDVIAYIRTLNQ